MEFFLGVSTDCTGRSNFLHEGKYWRGGVRQLSSSRYVRVAMLFPLFTQIGATILSAAGFGEGGVVAGTLASAVQSLIGNVAAGSAFAAAQSAGALGAGTAATVVGATTVAATTTTAAAATAQSKKSEKRPLSKL